MGRMSRSPNVRFAALRRRLRGGGDHRLTPNVVRLLTALLVMPVPTSVPVTVHCTFVPLPVLTAVPEYWKFAFWPGMNGAVNGLETRRSSGYTLPSYCVTRQLNLTLFSVVPPRLPYWPTSCGC